MYFLLNSVVFNIYLYDEIFDTLIGTISYNYKYMVDIGESVRF